jgi:surface protein
MDHMFIECSSFNQPLNNWNVSNVKDMNEMFMHSGFNQDISNWTLNENVTTDNIFADSFMIQKFKPPNSEPHYKDMITDDIIANHSTAYRDYIDKQYRIYEAKNFELTICDAVFLYLMFFDYYVNEFLRNNPILVGFKNEKLLRFFNKIIDVFDNYFLTQAPKITDESIKKQLNFVYRGEKQLCQGNTCRVGLMPGFTSTSPDIDVAMIFTNENDCCLYTYELPIGMPYIDVEDIITNTQSYCNIPPFNDINVTLNEYILPRGIVLSEKNIKQGFEDWDFHGTNKRIQTFTKSVSYDPNYIQNNPINLVAKYISNNNEDQEPLTKKQKI